VKCTDHGTRDGLSQFDQARCGSHRGTKLGSE